MFSYDRCQLCLRNLSHTVINKNSTETDLRRAVLDCKIEEMLMPGKYSLTRICLTCSTTIRRCAAAIRLNVAKRNPLTYSSPVACKCQICKSADEDQFHYVTSLSKTMRMVIFKLTADYLDKKQSPTIVYFCPTCYRLFVDMNSLLNKFYDHRLSK